MVVGVWSRGWLFVGEMVGVSFASRSGSFEAPGSRSDAVRAAQARIAAGPQAATSPAARALLVAAASPVSVASPEEARAAGVRRVAADVFREEAASPTFSVAPAAEVGPDLFFLRIA